MPNNSAESKARQRERQAAAAGSTKKIVQPATEVRQMNKRTWRQIGRELEHGADFACRLTDARLLQGNVLSVSLLVPVQYMHEVMQMTVDSQSRFCFMRGYLAPKRVFIDVADDENGEGDSTD